jgi:hypothetical protein
MALIEYFPPGTTVFVIHQNRVHSAKVKSVTITITENWRNCETQGKCYGVEFTGIGGRNFDVSADEIAATREELLAKL